MYKTTRDAYHRTFLLALVVSFFVLLLELTGVLLPFRRVLSSVVFPARKAGVYIVQLARFPLRFFLDKQAAYQRVEELESNYSEALAELSSLSGVEAENEYLRQLLQASDLALGEEIIVASVASLQSESIYLPKAARVEVGNPVSVSGTVVGRIQSLDGRIAKVTLLSQDFEAPLLAKTSSGKTGIVRGDGQRVLFTEVSPDEPLEVGERVVTLGQESVPPNLLIGKIGQLETQASDAVQTAVLEQLVSFFEVQLVEVHK